MIRDAHMQEKYPRPYQYPRFKGMEKGDTPESQKELSRTHRLGLRNKPRSPPITNLLKPLHHVAANPRTLPLPQPLAPIPPAQPSFALLPLFLLALHLRHQLPRALKPPRRRRRRLPRHVQRVGQIVEGLDEIRG